MNSAATAVSASAVSTQSASNTIAGRLNANSAMVDWGLPRRRCHGRRGELGVASASTVSASAVSAFSLRRFRGFSASKRSRSVAKRWRLSASQPRVEGSP